MYDVRVFAIFKQNYLSKNSSGFGQSLEEIYYLFDCHIWIVALASGFGNVTVRSFADDFFDLVPVVEIFGREDIIDGVGDRFAFDCWLFWLHQNKIEDYIKFQYWLLLLLFSEFSNLFLETKKMKPLQKKEKRKYELIVSCQKINNLSFQLLSLFILS